MRLVALFVLVLCALAGVSASSSHDVARMAVMNGVMSVRQHAAELSQAIHSAASMNLMSHSQMQVASFHQLSLSAFHSMAQPSASCVSAVLTLNATANSASCVSFTAILNSQNFSVSTAQLTSLCSSTCLQSMVTAVASVAVSCQTADAAALTTDITNLISFTNLVCTKDPNNANNFCLPQFITAVNGIGPGSSENFTNAQLSSICTPCTTIMMNGLVSYGIAPRSANNTISLLCSVDPNTNQYCIVEILSVAQVFSQFSSSNIPTITNAQFEPMCSPCAKRFAMVASSGFSTSLLDNMCVKSGNDFCIVKDVNALFALKSGGATGCTALGSFINSVGCCVNVLFSLDSTLSQSFNGLLQQCGIGSPGSCPVPSYTGTFSFVILNLAYSFYQQNPAAVNAAIVADLSLNLGVGANQISISNVVNAASTGSVSVGVTVTVTINFNSALTSSSAQTDFISNTKAGNFPLTAVAQLGPSSKIAPANPVTTSTTGASVSVTMTSPAAPQAPFSSLVLVVAAFIAMLFTRTN